MPLFDSYEDAFHPVLWRIRTFKDRLAALQQLEDAYATAQGREPRRVDAEELGSANGKLSKEGPIFLNTRLLLDTQYEDAHVFKAVNAVIHEGRHAFQINVVRGQAVHEDANDVEKWNENVRAYISGKRLRPDCFYMYRFQPVERDAHDYALKETRTIYERLQQKHGEIPSLGEYFKEEIGLTDVLAGMAATALGPNFVQEIDIRAHDYYEEKVLNKPGHVVRSPDFSEMWEPEARRSKEKSGQGPKQLNMFEGLLAGRNRDGSIRPTGQGGELDKTGEPSETVPAGTPATPEDKPEEPAKPSEKIATLSPDETLEAKPVETTRPRNRVTWTDFKGVERTGIPTGQTYRGQVEVKDAQGKTYFVKREKLEEAKGFEGLKYPESLPKIESEERPNENAEQGSEGKSGSGVAEKLPAPRVPETEKVRGTEPSGAGESSADRGTVGGGKRSDLRSGIQKENLGNHRGAIRSRSDLGPELPSDTGRTPANARGREPSSRTIKKCSDYSVPVGGLKREGTWFDTARRNVEIIELALKIESENRPATPEEQELLCKYTGFGASDIRNRLFPVTYGEDILRINPDAIYDKEWKDLAERLAKLPEDWQRSILQSTQYAHYTSENITRTMWAAAQHLGFTGGKVLEPGMGIGNFPMTMPEGLKTVCTYTGIEMDGPTALIGRLLFPEQNVLHSDYTKRKLPPNFFDFAIGNPPFSSAKITGDPAYAKHEFSLHDYFFAKTIDSVRPGGLVSFVTSRHTMDRVGDKARKYLQDRADLIGAIRLPQMAHQEAAGTSVVTDVLFFRKRMEGEAPAGARWMDRTEIETKDGPVPINEYYANHPEMVLGQVRKTGHYDDRGQRIGGERGYDLPTVISYHESPQALEADFAEAVKRLPANVLTITSKDPESIKRETAAVEFDPKVKREGALYLDDEGMVRQVVNGVGEDFFAKQNIPASQHAWFKDYVTLKDAINIARFDQFSDGPWEESLEKLQQVYKTFLNTHGPIQHFTLRTVKRADEDGNPIEIQYRQFKNKVLWSRDYDSPLVRAIEDITEDGEIVPSSFLKGRTIGKPVEAAVKTVHDALAVSLDTHGKLNVNDISTRMGIPQDEAIETLGDLIYKAPSGEWQLADEYLSGDVVKKLDEAKIAADHDRTYLRNVEALQKVIPKPLGHSQIRVILGAGWIPDKYVSEFAGEVLGAGQVFYDKRTESWQVAGGNRRSERTSGQSYGTNDRSPSEILEAALNGKRIVIKRTVKDGDTTRTFTDDTATEAVNDIIKRMKQEFSSWVWRDSERAQDLLDIYNRSKNNISPRKYKGDHLSLPGVSLKYNLYDHQKRVIWRVIQAGDTYLAHSVGAGKTIEMIAAGMEMRRLGMVRRPWYVVPNHMLEQFANEFMDVYPLANVMVADKEAFHTTNRKNFISQATLNNPDAVIITHSAFERIAVKPESVQPIKDKIINELMEALEETDNGDRIRRSQLEHRIEEVNQRFDKITGGPKDTTIPFEDTGCDFLFVDEAHDYRKLDFATNRKIKGIDPSGSRKAMDMFVKVKYLESENPGRSHVFASGTPVTNTMGELYSLMRFFMEDQMEEESIATFDGWASTFGDSEISMEPNAAGNYENVERFSRFVNVPELMSRVRSFMDVLTSSQLGALVKRPNIDGGKPEIIVVPSTPEQTAYREGALSARVATSKAWKPSSNERHNPDPMIAIISEGRKASIDPRFFEPSISSDTPSKLNRMADEIISEYNRTGDFTFIGKDGLPEAKKGGAQIVFYNLGFGEQIRQRGFDARQALTKRLTDAGIKRDEIAWFEDANTDAKKERVFKLVRAGEVRVLIGSAKKMGTGVNVQKRLTTMHYLDPPWYPSDFEQPQGRIVRQGNQNESVKIKLYATKGSYDEAMWSMVARKQRNIDQALTGDETVRNIEDVSEASQYEMAAALASGDRRVVQLAGLNNDISRLDRLAAAHADSQNKIRRDLEHIERYTLPAQRQRLEQLEKAKEYASEGYVSFESGSVDKQAFDRGQKEDFGNSVKKAYNQALKAYGAELKKNSKEAWSVAGFIGKVNGKYDLRANVYSRGDTIHGSELELGVGPAWFSIETGRSFDETISPTGLVQRMVNVVNRLDSNLRDQRERVKESETEAKRLRKAFGAPFEYEAERAEKIAEKTRLEEELVAEGVAAAQAGGHLPSENTEQNLEEQSYVEESQRQRMWLEKQGQQNAFTGANMPGGRPAVGRRSSGPVQTSPSREPFTTIGKAFRDIERQPVQIIGQPIKSFADVADLAQGWRNPNYEELRYIYVKNGVVVDHEGVTCRLPGSSSYYTGNAHDYVAHLKDRAKALGADKIYLVHNHPTGDPKPSASDVKVTCFLCRAIPEIAGHVVINSGKYGIIGPTGQVEILPLENLPSAWKDPILQPSIPHEALNEQLDSAQKVAGWAKALTNDRDLPVLIYLGAGLRVRGLQEVSVSALGDAALMRAKMPEKLVQFGATGVVLAIPDHRREEILDVATELIEKHHVLLDAVGNHPDGSYFSVQSGVDSFSRYYDFLGGKPKTDFLAQDIREQNDKYHHRVPGEDLQAGSVGEAISKSGLSAKKEKPVAKYKVSALDQRTQKEAELGEYDAASHAYSAFIVAGETTAARMLSEGGAVVASVERGQEPVFDDPQLEALHKEAGVGRPGPLGAGASYHEKVAEKTISLLERGVAPWQKPCNPGETRLPFNPVSGSRYRGGNLVLLAAEAIDRGFTDLRWLTYKQAQQIGAHVRAGEKGTRVEYWKFEEHRRLLDDNGQPVLGKDGKTVTHTIEKLRRPKMFSAVVFNAEQIDRMPELEEKSVTWTPNERTQSILKNSGAKILHDQADKAFYRPANDTIHLPDPSQFDSVEAYYAIALHELSHWTGAKSRLDRDIRHPFGSLGYAKEELRAEIASFMLGEELRVGHDPENHAAYVKSWINILRDDPQELFRASAAAEKIMDYVLDLEVEKQQEVKLMIEEREQDQGQGHEGVDLEAERSILEQVDTYIAVPFVERMEAKALGAEWDRDAKSWYVPQGQDLALFERWAPKAPLPQETDPVKEFATALSDAGLRLDGPPFMDGKLHRVPVEGDRAGGRSGAYRAYLDGRPAGMIQNWKTGFKCAWKSNGTVLSPEERANLLAEAAQKRIDRQHELERLQEQKAAECEARLSSLGEASAEHPYLARKGVEAYGLYVNGYGDLVVPLKDALGKLWSLQRIKESGEKPFEKDARKQGCFHTIGDLREADEILIAEGYATAASVYEATGRTVVVALDSGNLLPVAKALHETYPAKHITILGDDDRHLPDREPPLPNVGREKAIEAAREVEGNAIFPTFLESETGAEFTDFNDLTRSRGLESVLRQIDFELQRGKTRAEEVERARERDVEHELNREQEEQEAEMEMSL